MSTADTRRDWILFASITFCCSMISAALSAPFLPDYLLGRYRLTLALKKWRQFSSYGVCITGVPTKQIPRYQGTDSPKYTRLLQINMNYSSWFGLFTIFLTYFTGFIWLCIKRTMEESTLLCIGTTLSYFWVSCRSVGIRTNSTDAHLLVLKRAMVKVSIYVNASKKTKHKWYLRLKKWLSSAKEAQWMKFFLQDMHMTMAFYWRSLTAEFA